MPSKSCTSEEKFPLLLLFLEDGQRNSKQNKKIMIDKGRYQGIASGASNLITRWPGHVTSCWTTAMLIGVSLFLIAMLMMTLSLHPGMHPFAVRCKRNNIKIRNNSSIIHLVHGPSSWTNTQLYSLEQIAQNNPQLKVELILIRIEIEPSANKVARDLTHIQKMNNNLTYPKKINLSTSIAPQSSTTQLSENKSVSTKFKTNSYAKKTFQFGINVGPRKLIEMFIKHKRFQKTTIMPKTIKTTSKQTHSLKDIVEMYPNIQIVRTTFERVFMPTPLYFTWQNTNIDTRLFAIRVLQLWNYAGISFGLPYNNYPPQNIPEQKSTTLINVTNFGNLDLPPGLVIVDEEGLYMETRTTCHAFFGEMLMALTKATVLTKPSEVIRHTLHLFCIKGAVDPKYCDKLRG